MVPGAGATEIELAKQITTLGEVSTTINFLKFSGTHNMTVIILKFE